MLESVDRNPWPIGTFDELVDAGLDPQKFGSCSPPQGDKNIGCAWYHKCRFKNLRDQIGELRGPEFVKWDHTNPAGRTITKIDMCWGFYHGGNHDIMATMHENGHIIDNFGLAGDKYEERIRRPLHVEVDPKCRACRTNTCNKMTTVTEEKVVPTYDRLGEAGRQAAFNQKRKEEFRDKLERQHYQEAVERHLTEPDRPTAPESPRERNRPAPRRNYLNRDFGEKKASEQPANS